jgi:deferrochelatase/peroxidase EfeB
MSAARLSRRRFLGAAAAGSTAAIATTACADETVSSGGSDATAGVGPRYLPFEGPHQTGIFSPAPAAGLMAAFNLTTNDVGDLRDTFQALTVEARRMMSGDKYPEREPEYPALYTGTVGNPPPAADLSVVVSVGASLFDERFGLADRAPNELERMPFLTNDKLDPARTHGDILITINSDHEDINIFALRQLARATRRTMTLHWMLDGYNRRTSTTPRPGEAGVRNLMGFVDGTANLDPGDDEIMDRLVWVGPDDREPDWAVGGSYQAVRVIRMFVEFWDRTRLGEQEAIMGRHRQSGAPLGQDHETDVPDYAADPDGAVIPLDAHIRLANDRSPEAMDQRFLRKGFSFSRGFDGDGHLDQGLAFVSFQRSMSKQFLPVQERLKGEPLEEYIEPQGGGFFFALPGVTAPDGHLGDQLLA